MVCCEGGEAVGHEVELLRTVHLRNTDAHAFLTASGHGQGYGTYTISHKFSHELRSRHSFIACCIEETVADRLLTVFFINYMESVPYECILGQSSPACILPCLADESVLLD